MSSDNNSRELHRIGEHELHGPDYQLVCVWAEESGMSGEDVLRILFEAKSIIENGGFTELRIDLENLPITSLMPKIEGLVVKELRACGGFTKLDLSSAPNLTELWCDENQLTALDLSPAPNLSYLRCSENQLTTLDLSPVPNLTHLCCSESDLTALDLRAVPYLTHLWCSKNPLTALDLCPVPNLTELACGENQLTALDLSSAPNLTVLSCSGNQLTSLDLSSAPNLTELYCSENDLRSLDLSSAPNLTRLYCSGNQLTSLDLSSAPNLVKLDCKKNQLRSLDLGSAPNCTELLCDENQLTALDLSPVPNLTYLLCNENQLTELDIRPVRELDEEFSNLHYDNDKTRLIQSESKTDKPVLTFSDDSLIAEVFGYADIPEKWWDGDYMSEVDHYAIVNAVYETASYVSEDEFDGPPGMSANYYKVYADCESEFRTALSAMLLKLLEASPA